MLRKKIAIVAGNFPVRSETFIKDHVIGLADHGHQIYIISTGIGSGIRKSEIEKIDSINNISRIDLSPLVEKDNASIFLACIEATIKRPRLARFWSGAKPWARTEIFSSYFVWKTIQEINPDIVHIHHGHKAGPLCEFPFKQTVLVTWHGFDANCIPKTRGDKVYSNLFGKGWNHTVGSNFMKTRLLSIGASEQNISIIPLGINLNLFGYLKNREISNRSFRLISVGRLDELKGHQFLIEAVSKLLREGADLKLNIIGDGVLRHQLNKQIIDSGFPHKIQLLGAKNSEEVAKHLKSSDLFCLTCVEAKNGRIESQGMVFAEAQATGLPIVSSNIGGIPDSVIDGQTGILCPPRDVESIKRAIIFFINNKEQIANFGFRGRKLVEERFQIDRMLEEFEALYDVIHSKYS